MTDTHLLIADIGGTNARFAFASEDAPYFDRAQTLQTGDYATIEEAIDHYMASQELVGLDGICFAVAGPIHDQSVRFTNNDWFIQASALRERFACEKVRLLNDFESISYSLIQLGEQDIVSIGPQATLDRESDFTLAVLGPGSGLGVAGACQRDGHYITLATEAGHIGFAPGDDLQKLILRYLKRKYERVSNERLLSGPGLVNINEALYEINGQPNPGLGPADIAVAARENSDPLAAQTLNIFFQILGQVAGDMALALGAYQGVFIGGGIAQRYPDRLAASKFREGFEDKGRFEEMMKPIPTWLISHTNPGLLGASVFARGYL